MDHEGRDGLEHKVERLLVKGPASPPPPPPQKSSHSPSSSQEVASEELHLEAGVDIADEETVPFTGVGAPTTASGDNFGAFNSKTDSKTDWGISSSEFIHHDTTPTVHSHHMPFHVSRESSEGRERRESIDYSLSVRHLDSLNSV